MLILRGSPALSQFRLQKLRQDLVAAGLPVRAISAEFVHVVELLHHPEPIERVAALTAAEHTILEKLLTYGPSRAAVAVDGLVQVVAPRPGTISPWSSKATDIAHICGLAAVKRIERVIAYTIDLGGVSLTGSQLSALSSQLWGPKAPKTPSPLRSPRPSPGSPRKTT